jgi:hypothetical protein
VNGLAGAVTSAGSPGHPLLRCLAGFDDGTGPALFAGGSLAWAGANPSQGIAKWSGARPHLSLTQSAGPGSGVVVRNLGLDLGAETFNVFSLTPCIGGVGTGPYMGLCATNPADLVTQVLLPLGIEPFHFLAPGSSATFGPYPVWAGATLEGICFTWSGGGLGCVSPVRRLVVQ